MKLNNDSTALTHWYDDNDSQWDIKILFSYQPEEGPDYEDGHMVYPGCQAGIVDIQIERNEPIYDVTNWVEFDGASTSDEATWAMEILTLITAGGNDDRGNEQ